MNKEFKVSEVLKVEQTKSVVAKSNLIDGNIPYVTRTVSDNGYTRTCGNTDKINKGNCITIGAETGVAFYQPADFVAGNKVYRLSRKGLCEAEYLYLAAVLNTQTKNYSYSNARIPEKIKAETLSLPVIPSSDPSHTYTPADIDWQYMRDRITELERDRITELERDRITELDAYLKATGLDDYELTEEDKKVLSLSKKSASDEDGAMDGDCGIRKKEFRIGDLFDWSNGNTDLKKTDINGRGLPVISSGVSGCGIIGCTDIPARIQPAHTITVDMFGYAFYRDFEYKEVTHARVFTLISKGFALNERTGNYIVAQLKWLPSAYSYNNMCTYEKLKDSMLSLPVTSSGEPDWDYMEKYIRAMEKVVIADVVKWKDKEIEATKKIVG